MIPYSYQMVDMGGIDLAEANGTVVEGLYDRLVIGRNACGDLILYNWKFAGIEIASSACSTLDAGTSILINGVIQVTEQDEVSIPSIIPPPVIASLHVTENGEYIAPDGVDGYSPVTVDVESSATNINVYRGKLAINTGRITSDSNYCYTDLIPIENVAGTWYLDIARSNLSSFYIGISFFAQDGTSIAGYIRQYEQYRRYSQFAIPDAKFFRIAARVSDLQTLNMTVEGGTKLSVVNPYSKAYTLKGE